MADELHQGDQDQSHNQQKIVILPLYQLLHT